MKPCPARKTKLENCEVVVWQENENGPWTVEVHFPGNFFRFEAAEEDAAMTEGLRRAGVPDDESGPVNWERFSLMRPD